MTDFATKVLSGGISGLETIPVEVQIAPSRGVIHFQVIGLPDSAVRESTHRVLAALTSAELQIPRGPILINLAPAATRKQGTTLDLALALGVAAAGGSFPPNALAETLVVGELSLDGQVRPVHGAFLAGCLARKLGLKRIICPAAEAGEMALAAGAKTEVWGVKNLLEAALLITGRQKSPRPPPPIRIRPAEYEVDLNLADVKGQARAIKALIIAAAGGHHLLLKGPPGAGKSFLSLRLPGILPRLAPAEQVEVTRIRSAAGLPVYGLAGERPFRAPHHTVSYAGLIGGGTDPRPGEVTLAHRGVLFLDELPEFERRTLEVLRQPLEEGTVHLGRARQSRIYPARFLLVAAMNPCPCGFLDHPTRPCTCPPRAINAYQARVSGPLLDRLDLRVWVPPVAPEDLLPANPPTATSVLDSGRAREQVAKARRIQEKRFTGFKVVGNGEIPAGLLAHFAPLTPATRKLLLTAMRRLDLSARGLVRVRRVARTLADLAGSEEITTNHICEALAFRNEKRGGSV